MGLGIFAARKIALLNRINNLEMMMMQITSQQSSLADQSAQVAMDQTALKMRGSIMQQPQSNPWAQVTGMALGFIGGGFGMGQQAAALGQNVGTLLSGGGANNAAGAYNMQAQSSMMDMKLMEIHRKEKALQTTMKRLETQLALANREYESVEKGEQKAIERATPKFS